MLRSVGSNNANKVLIAEAGGIPPLVDELRPRAPARASRLPKRPPKPMMSSVEERELLELEELSHAVTAAL